MQSAPTAAAAPGAFSPELALVDPVAAELARLALPRVALFEDTLLSRPSGQAELHGPFEEPEVERRDEKARRRGQVRVLRRAAIAVVAAGLLAAGAASGAPEVRVRAATVLADAARTPAQTSSPRSTRASKRTETAPPRTIPVFVRAPSPDGAYRWPVWRVDAAN